MATSTIKFGIAGLGRIGKVHLANVHRYCPSAEVIGACHVRDEHSVFAAKHGITTFYTTYAEMVSDTAIDAVIIASPTTYHYEHIVAAAEAGKHIFCEKPIDLSLEKVQRVTDLISKSGIHFMVGFNRRFDPHVLQLKAALDEGKVGKPQIVKITSRDPGPPPLAYIKTSGGLFLDMAIHDFDMARYLVSDEVVQVHASGSIFGDFPLAQFDDIDTAVVTLTFKNGCMAVIDNSRNSVYGYDQRLEVFGAKGLYGTKNITEDALFARDSNGYHAAKPKHFFIERYAESYRNILLDFVNAIQQNKAPAISARDGLAALTIAMAAKKSLKENQVVALL